MAFRAASDLSRARKPVAKRHVKQAKKRSPFDLRQYNNDFMRRMLHTGSIQSRNLHRRLFREVDSEISSCFSLHDSPSAEGGNSPRQ